MSFPMSRAAAGCALAVALATSGVAHADLSKKVIAAFKGQIVVTAAEVEPGANDKATIDAYKKARLKEVKGEPNADDAVAWHFFYTAFLKSTGVTEMKLEFYSGDKYVANESLSGIDPKSTVLSGQIDINEDEGPAKGKPYTVKLVGEVRGKEVVFATTPLTLN
ncbi:MAG: hypothetical protein K8W52_14545 [Deltaproteobacteria bacterium]|nr:hypothetical protein [Deltaproteobacteria bacterium]